MSWLQSLKEWAKRLRKQIIMLWFASRHPQMPWLPKIIAVVAVAYAFSPIDLIPDFIPILGFVDDAIILPILIWLALRFTPEQVIFDAEQQANEWLDEHEKAPRNYLVAVLIILIWITLAVMAYFYLGGGL
ncbi:YkvA family protein [Acinetobacter seifertii]|uniref:YkvA family protein n=1 Tax=Acinetobacter seifertii TaxID=1530123 RepID=UPI0032B335E5